MRDDLNRIDTAELDRFVDGELTPAEQAWFLNQLDQCPEGWRSLALAFVEAQAWRDGLRSALADHDTLSVHQPQRHVAGDLPRREVPAQRRLRMLCLSLIVSLCIFGLGFATGSSSQMFSQSEELARIPGRLQPSGVAAAQAQNTREHEHVAATQLDEFPDAVRVMFQDGSSDVPQVVDVPILQTNDAIAAASLSRTVVPAEVQELLRRSGHEVTERAGYWPVVLPSGQQVVIPVNQVQLNYRGPRPFQ